MLTGFRQAHPAVLVTAGLFCIAAIQVLSDLPFWLLAAALLGVAVWLDSATLLRLLRRSRWIAVSILILFAWQTPGRAIFPMLWKLSPSYEGLMLAALHACRLGAMIAVVSILMSRLQAADWVTGLNALATPFRCLGLPTDRFAVRLMLVLEAMNQRDVSARESWRALLTLAPEEGHGQSEHWELRALRRPESLLLVAAWLTCSGVLVWHALS